jgi:hypothetical protein
MSMMFPEAPPDSIDLPQEAPQDPSSAGGDSLQQSIDNLMAFLQSHQDAEERAMASKALQILHQLQAIDQKQADATMGVTPQMKLARKSG